MRFTTETAGRFGRRGGQASTPAKRRAARRNGRKRKRLRGLVEIMTSSRSEEWYTPPALFSALSDEFGGFTLDPCCTPDSALCPEFYTAEDDGLTKPWSGSVFMNPPYGAAIGRWMRKAWEECQRGALVVCLVPARTDTSWWHDVALRGEVRFLRGRLKFSTPSGPPTRGSSALFPSAVVIFRPAPDPAGATLGPRQEP